MQNAGQDELFWPRTDGVHNGGSRRSTARRAFAAIGWMALWLCWVTVALLQRLRKAYHSDRTWG